MMIRGFLFTLATMGLAAVIIAPLLWSLTLLPRHASSRAALVAWAVGAVIYVAAASTALTWILYASGLIAWVEQP